MSQEVENQYQEEMSFQEALEMSTARNSFEGVPAKTQEQPADTPAPETGNEAEQALEGKTAEPAPDAQPEQEQPKAQEAPPDRSWTRLMAREAALEAERAKLDQMKVEIESRANKPVEQSNWQEDFEVHPVHIIAERFGNDPAKLQALAQDLWYEAKGSEAPANYHAMRAARSAELKIARMERRGVEGQRESAAEQPKAKQDTAEYVQQVHRDYADKMSQFIAGDLSQYQRVKAAVEIYGAEGVSQAMYGIGVSEAQRTGGKTVLTPEQALQKFDEQLQKLQAGMSGGSTPQAAPKAESQRQAPTSLRNQHQQTQPDRTGDDPMSDEVLRRKACEEAGIPFYGE